MDIGYEDALRPSSLSLPLSLVHTHNRTYMINAPEDSTGAPLLSLVLLLLLLLPRAI